MDIDVKTTDAVTVVGIGFDIDGKTAPGLQSEILALLTAQRPLILEMSRVAYMSSAGLRVLLTTFREATNSGVQLRLCGLSAELRDMMSATGFLSFFTTFDNLDDAVESLK